MTALGCNRAILRPNSYWRVWRVGERNGDAPQPDVRQCSRWLIFLSGIGAATTARAARILLTALGSLTRIGLDAQPIFQNTHQVVKFVGACAFLADVFSQTLYFLLERGFIGRGRSCLSCWAGTCWSWSCSTWGRWSCTCRKQLRWLCGRLQHRR